MPPLTPIPVRLAAHSIRVGACLEWTGHRDRNGYPMLKLAGRQVLAHRLAWGEAHPGEPLPPLVRHTCDNPPCIEPAHLLAGGHAENMADRDERGRTLRGQAHASARLTDLEVAAIRAEYAAGGISQRALGRKYGVSGPHVCQIVQGKYRRADVTPTGSSR